ncbi:hypothetical protein BD779DRAFT_1148828 [Infundibulicybe gibba]|nr:hypothetical protein BD779DRAFT_1148828 [Infundibulicybe gibba]
MDSDIALFLHHENCENELQDDLEVVVTATAAILASVEQARQRRIENRRPNRLYLCRSQLLPNPRSGTPWEALYNSGNDRAYITTMGFDVKTFHDILNLGFGEAYLSAPIPRNDTSHDGAPRPGARSLDPAGALGLVLHYLNSTMREISLQQIFAVIPSSLNRYLLFGLSILLRTLRRIDDAKIQWPPAEEEFHECSNLIIARHPALAGAFGSTDGLKVHVQESQDEEIENATFNGWLSEHFISCVLAFSPKGSGRPQPM